MREPEPSMSWLLLPLLNLSLPRALTPLAGPTQHLVGLLGSINTLEPLSLSSPALDSRGIGINNRGSCPQEAHVEFLSTYCVLEPKEGTGDKERK